MLYRSLKSTIDFDFSCLCLEGSSLVAVDFLLKWLSASFLALSVYIIVLLFVEAKSIIWSRFLVLNWLYFHAGFGRDTAERKDTMPIKKRSVHFMVKEALMIPSNPNIAMGPSMPHSQILKPIYFLIKVSDFSLKAESLIDHPLVLLSVFFIFLTH